MGLIQGFWVRCFETTEGVIRGIGLRRSGLGRATVAGLNYAGQFGLATYFLLRRRPVVVMGQQMDTRTGERGSFRSTLELLLDRYEPDTTRLFQRLLRPDMTVVDIGAHRGFFSLISASRVGSGGRVYSFEPHPGNFEALQRNIQLNGYKNITAVRKAVADKTGVMKLFVNPKGSDRHSLYARENVEGLNNPEVETTTLDEFLQTLNWPCVDLVKMDIEGAEPAAFAGMRQALEKCRIRFVVAEFSPPLLKAGGFDPLGFLQEVSNIGFALYTIEGEKEPKPLSRDGFFDLVRGLRDRGGTNLLCERIRCLPSDYSSATGIASWTASAGSHNPPQ